MLLTINDRNIYNILQHSLYQTFRIDSLKILKRFFRHFEYAFMHLNEFFESSKSNEHKHS